MRVIDHGPQLWFLLGENGDLFLSGRYQDGFADYAYPMRLSAEEKEAYEHEGHRAIARLFERVQYSRAFRSDSRSPYSGRKEPEEVSDRMHAAILAWRS